MRGSNSLLHALLKVLPHLRSQVYFKASLTALSHAMEDLVLVGTDRPLVIANFQQERFYRQEVRRYRRIAQRTDQLYVLAALESKFATTSTPYVTVSFEPDESLAQEWHLIIIGQQYAACIVCREHASPVDAALLDQARQFRGIWSFDRQVSAEAARLLLEQILVARPELATRIEQARQRYGLNQTTATGLAVNQVLEIDARLFTDRLVTYLQASQYKQLKAYRTITIQERKQRLLNSITTAIRHSLNLEEIFGITIINPAIIEVAFF